MAEKSTGIPEQRLLSVFLGCRSVLSRLVRRIVKRHDVEDILQEAFIRSYEAGQSTVIRSPRAFLLKTATHLALNHISRSANRLTTYMEELSPSEVYELTADPPEARLDANERFTLFCRAVGSLPEQCRHVFVLKKVYGLSQKEIAKELGIAESTVEKHIAKGLLLCTQYMQACEAGPAAPAEEGVQRADRRRAP